jgi:hypothetical protein
VRHAETLRRGEDGAHSRSSVEEVLEVVEQEQELPPSEETGEVVARSDRLGYLRRHELGVGEAGERNPEDAVAQRADQLGRDLEREASLSRAARIRDGEEPCAVGEQRDELTELVVPPDERARSDRQVGGVKVRSGGKSPSLS